MIISNYHHVNNNIYNSFVYGLISFMENYTQFSVQRLNSKSIG